MQESKKFDQNVKREFEFNNLKSIYMRIWCFCLCCLSTIFTLHCNRCTTCTGENRTNLTVRLSGLSSPALWRSLQRFEVFSSSSKPECRKCPSFCVNAIGLQRLMFCFSLD